MKHEITLEEAREMLLEKKAFFNNLDWQFRYGSKDSFDEEFYAKLENAKEDVKTWNSEVKLLEQKQGELKGKKSTVKLTENLGEKQQF